MFVKKFIAKSKFSFAELAIEFDSNHTNTNQESIKQAEYQPQELFKGVYPKLEAQIWYVGLSKAKDLKQNLPNLTYQTEPTKLSQPDQT